MSTKATTLVDDVRKLAAEYAQRAMYVQNSNPRAAEVFRGIARRLTDLARQHSPKASFEEEQTSDS